MSEWHGDELWYYHFPYDQIIPINFNKITLSSFLKLQVTGLEPRSPGAQPFQSGAKRQHKTVQTIQNHLQKCSETAPKIQRRRKHIRGADAGVAVGAWLQALRLRRCGSGCWARDRALVRCGCVGESVSVSVSRAGAGVAGSWARVAARERSLRSLSLKPGWWQG